MTKFSKLSIRTQFIVLAILLTLPALGIIVYSGFKQRADDYRLAVIESQKLADNLAAGMESLVNESEQLGSLIAELPDVKKRNAVKVSQILTKALKHYPQYHNILISDASGNVWASTFPFTEITIFFGLKIVL